LLRPSENDDSIRKHLNFKAISNFDKCEDVTMTGQEMAHGIRHMMDAVIEGRR
jgi:hypothetical protein